MIPFFLVGTAVDMTIICFESKERKKNISQLLFKLSVNLEAKLHSSQDLQGTRKSKGLQVATVTN